MSEPLHQPKAITRTFREKPRHPRHRQKRRLLWVVGITGGVMVLELVEGIRTGGIALLSDAFHRMAHFVGYGVTLTAILLAERDAPPERTYRYWRLEILAALFNGLLLLGLVGFILWRAYQAATGAHEILLGEMLVVATIGLAANIVLGLALTATSQDDMNTPGAFLHAVFDSISSIAVIISGLLVLWTGQTWFDPLGAMVISIFVLCFSLDLIIESCRVLLEWAPRRVKIEDVAGAMRQTRGVAEVHDLHVWVITSRMYSLTAHVVLADDVDLSRAREISREIDAVLDRLFDITHTCYQFEVRKVP